MVTTGHIFTKKDSSDRELIIWYATWSLVAISLSYSLIYAINFKLIYYPIITGIGSIIGVVYALLQKNIRNLNTRSHVLIGLYYIFLITLSTISGGTHSSVIPWMSSIALLAVILLPQSQTLTWFLIPILSLFGFYLVSITNIQLYNEVESIKQSNRLFIDHFGFYFLLYLLGKLSNKVKNQSEKETHTLEANLANAKNLASVGELSGNIAHEINNPLEVINTSSFLTKQLLKKETLTEDDMVRLREATEEISLTVGKVSKIVHGLKSLSYKSEQEGFTTFKLCEVIDEVETIVTNKLKFNGIKLISNISEEYSIHANRAQIGQVIMNLIGNSIHAMKDHVSEEKTIELSAKVLAKKLIIRVEDSGPGIPEHHHSKVFTPFFTTKGRGVGTGLGLSICLNIIQNHGGSVAYDDSGKGAAFVLSLPIQ